MSRLQAAVAVREQQHRVAMDLPEAAQYPKGGRRQRHEAVYVALRVADMHARTGGIDVARLQPHPFAEAQPRL